MKKFPAIDGSKFTRPPLSVSATDFIPKRYIKIMITYSQLKVEGCSFWTSNLFRKCRSD